MCIRDSFKAGAKSIAVNVRYSDEVSECVYQYVYVTFTWTPSPLNFTPNEMCIRDSCMSMGSEEENPFR